MPVLRSLCVPRDAASTTQPCPNVTPSAGAALCCHSDPASENRSNSAEAKVQMPNRAADCGLMSRKDLSEDQVFRRVRTGWALFFAVIFVVNVAIGAPIGAGMAAVAGVGIPPRARTAPRA